MLETIEISALATMNITPALSGIIYFSPPVILRDHWDDWIQPILNAEQEKIYKAVIEAIKLAERLNRNRYEASELFMAILESDWREDFLNKNENESKNDSKKLLLEAVFREYSYISDKSNCWREIIKNDQNIPYNEVLDEWQIKSKNVIEKCQIILERLNLC